MKPEENEELFGAEEVIQAEDKLEDDVHFQFLNNQAEEEKEPVLIGSGILNEGRPLQTITGAGVVEDMKTIQPVQSESGSLMTIIERVCMNPDADISKLEKMIDLQERILNRDSLTAYNSAMSLLQSELPSIAQNGQIKHKDTVIANYSKFEDIQRAIQPAISKHGFSVTFKSDFKDNFLFITGKVSHRQGHCEETTMKLPFDTSGAKNSVQAIGSSVSYGKRYTLCMLLNIATGGEDNDANSVSEPASISVEQAKELKDLLQRTESDVKKFCKVYSIDSVDSMPATFFFNAKKTIERKLQNIKGA